MKSPFLTHRNLIGCASIFILSLLMTSCGSSSNVFIPAQQEFVLGKFQKSSFKASLTNKGNQEIVVKAVDKKTGEQTQSFGLSPNQEATLRVSENETVLLQNESSTEGKVKARFNKTVSGMSYQELN